VLRRFSCDSAILLESKLEEISRHITLSLWGGRPFDGLFRPYVGRSRGFIIILNSQALKLIDSRIGLFLYVCS